MIQPPYCGVLELCDSVVRVPVICGPAGLGLYSVFLIPDAWVIPITSEETNVMRDICTMLLNELKN